MLVTAPVTAPAFVCLSLQPVEQLVRGFAVAAKEQHVGGQRHEVRILAARGVLVQRLGLQRGDLLREIELLGVVRVALDQCPDDVGVGRVVRCAAEVCRARAGSA